MVHNTKYKHRCKNDTDTTLFEVKCGSFGLVDCGHTLFHTLGLPSCSRIHSSLVPCFVNLNGQGQFYPLSLSSWDLFSILFRPRPTLFRISNNMHLTDFSCAFFFLIYMRSKETLQSFHRTYNYYYLNLSPSRYSLT